MYILDKVKAKVILLNELKYKEYAVDSFLERYPEIHDELSESVTKWLEDRSVVDVSAFGISLKELMSFNNRDLLMAVKDMNSLFDEDMDDEKRKDWIRILRTPHNFE